MPYNQFETIKRLHDFHRNKMVENLTLSVKLPFYNAHPYKPTKQELVILKNRVKNIEIVPNV